VDLAEKSQHVPMLLAYLTGPAGAVSAGRQLVDWARTAAGIVSGFMNHFPVRSSAPLYCVALGSENVRR
jgi:hypothetical protein